MFLERHQQRHNISIFGACAAVIAARARGLVDKQVVVSTRGGELGISWAGEGTPVVMTGPAVTVFEGEIEL